MAIERTATPAQTAIDLAQAKVVEADAIQQQRLGEETALIERWQGLERRKSEIETLIKEAKQNAVPLLLSGASAQTIDGAALQFEADTIAEAGKHFRAELEAVRHHAARASWSFQNAQKELEGAKFMAVRREYLTAMVNIWPIVDQMKSFPVHSSLIDGLPDSQKIGAHLLD